MIKAISAKNIKEFYELINKDKFICKQFTQLGWSKNNLINHLNNNICSSIGFYKNQCLIGFLLGNLLISNNFSEFEILHIYVCPNNRKKGYASEMLRYIELKKIKKPGIVTLEVSESNIYAINFYHKNFYKKKNTRYNYYLNDQGLKTNAFIMNKEINEQ